MTLTFASFISGACSNPKRVTWCLFRHKRNKQFGCSPEKVTHLPFVKLHGIYREWACEVWRCEKKHLEQMNVLDVSVKIKNKIWLEQGSVRVRNGSILGECEARLTSPDICIKIYIFLIGNDSKIYWCERDWTWLSPLFPFLFMLCTCQHLSLRNNTQELNLEKKRERKKSHQ